MLNEQVAMGVIIALLCVAGLYYDRWFLSHSKKGQRLVIRLGERKATWVVRLLFTAGALFGTLLATDVIRPVQW